MGKVGLAFRAFFKTLFDRETATQVEQLFRHGTMPKVNAPDTTAPVAIPTKKPELKPSRSDALTLLATLQREARLIDLVQEPLNQYSDQQVGAAARDVLTNCNSVLERLFAIQPVLGQSEGEGVEVPRGFEAAKYRLTGNVTGEPPFRGTLAHHGWKATKADIPEWTGSKEAALIIAPAEVELK